MATDFVGGTHIAAHVLIFFGYLAGMVLVPGALRSIMHVSRLTVIAGAGFFVTCGLTHLGLALGQSEVWWVTVSDHLQAGFILVFALTLIRDLQRIGFRLAAAYQAIGVKYGVETMMTIRATIRSALED